MSAKTTVAERRFSIESPYYPIVYVRGYAMTASERDQVFHDAYYGFSITSVEKRQAPPPEYFEADVFEGIMIRLMKDHNYLDASNRGLNFPAKRGTETVSGTTGYNPSRSLWVSRFYDVDYFKESVRHIRDHAEDLRKLICDQIPKRLERLGVDTSDYKVILLAHSMGGLVCRTLIQNLLPENKEDPKKWIHRLVTIATPHRGIDLGAIPDILEDRVATMLNPFDAGMFKKEAMRSYLNLDLVRSGNEARDDYKDEDEKYVYDIHSLGPDQAYPVKRCLCIIGSDWSSYGTVRRVTGGFSDGLVKQDRAFLVSGPRPMAPNDQPDWEPKYDDAHRAFWANVHRAHSGYRGIVNSYETYENIQRFLFGDTILRLDLEEIDIRTRREPGSTYLYDFEFLLSIRGTPSYLHRREQDPCENAIRVELDGDGKIEPPKSLFLHTGFMDRRLRRTDEPYSHFALTFRVIERRIKDGLLWDHEYPARVIYGETMEARIDDANAVEYRWLSDLGHQEGRGWLPATADDDGVFRFPLREAKSFSAALVVRPGDWPDLALTQDAG